MKNKEIMEQLNIENLFNEESKQTKNSSILVDYKRNAENNKIAITYKETFKDGKVISISGRKGSSFIKTTQYLGSPLEEYAEFYASGNLYQKGTRYIGFLRESSNKKMYRPDFNIGVGTWRQYSDSGEITKDWNTEEGFKIDVNHVLQILERKEHINIQNNIQNLQRKTIAQVVAMKKVWEFEADNINPSWFIQYTNLDNKELLMLVDGVTGKTLYQGIISTEEDEN